MPLVMLCRKSYHACILIVTLLALTGLAVGCKKDEVPKQVINEMKAVREEQRERQQRELDEQGYITPDTSEAKRLAAMSEEAARSASPEAAAVLKKNADLLREISELVDEYSAMLERFVEAGGMEAAGEKDSFPIRIELLETLRDQNDLLDTHVPQILTQIDDAPAPADLEYMSHLRETDRRWMNAAIELLDIYHANYDLWELQDDGTVLFAESVPDSTVERAGELMATIQRATEAQTVLQREHLRRNAKP
jgi:hypothetical protein